MLQRAEKKAKIPTPHQVRVAYARGLATYWRTDFICCLWTKSRCVTQQIHIQCVLHVLMKSKSSILKDDFLTCPSDLVGLQNTNPPLISNSLFIFFYWCSSSRGAGLFPAVSKVWHCNAWIKCVAGRQPQDEQLAVQFLFIHLQAHLKGAYI